MTNLAFFDFVSLRSLSYLWVSGNALPVIRWRLAILSPSIVFPTRGYRGNNASG